MKKTGILLLLIFLFIQTNYAQYQVAITIDDVPNTQRKGFSDKLLTRLSKLDIPLAIFINEGKIYEGSDLGHNFAQLTRWIKPPKITLGNHTFSHARYSTVGLAHFQKDISKGAFITRELAKKYRKPLQYFRFPYNDLGKDSLQHVQIKRFLESQKYRLTPFTIESSDWMFNYLYEHYLKKGQRQEAQRIGNTYVQKTLEYFKYFEQLAQKLYKRPVSHIYLCHDSPLNADYLPDLLENLKGRKYTFISLDDALKDQIYQQDDRYHKKWGVSWLYRWIKNRKLRSLLMNKEPSLQAIFKEYQKISAQK